ncbi:hypothetical protein V1264_024795 [Littorina saxatilis]|uniref:Sulfotransferase domain-containing protein n=2 Tax=Littorina saxatilis TaxID=31220 RepID=A0AAN9G082_9CAEN
MPDSETNNAELWGTRREVGVNPIDTRVAPGLSRPPSTQRHPLSNTSVLKETADAYDIPEIPNMKVKVIILTYMRSGSSMTGDVFNHHPEVFYVYEPLWSLQRYFTNDNLVFRMSKGPVQTHLNKFYDPDSVTTGHVKAFLDCDFGSLDPSTLIQYHLKNSLTTSAYHQCMTQNSGIVGSIRCLPKMVTPCRKANVTVVKTIRFSMAQAARLVQLDPTVKVVHLIRDPRGTLRSQSRVGEFKPKDIVAASKKLCDRVLNDLKEGEKLKTLHKGRVLTVRYEDIATEPLKFAQKLLHFAGLNMDKTLRQYVWNITSAGLPDNCVICTTRNDSKKTALNWRTKMDFQTTKIVDSSCQEVYRRMGYLPLAKREELLNLTIPSFVDVSNVPGVWV